MKLNTLKTISYSQTDDTPDDLVKYIENERTLAPDAIVNEIKSRVVDPKQYYYDLSKKKSSQSINNFEGISLVDLG